MIIKTPNTVQLKKTKGAVIRVTPKYLIQEKKKKKE